MVAVFRGSTRRLPGFRFETQAPQLAEVLPRMDVAAFVGFAASGPIETPVAVESAAQFAAIFGEDAPLALDHRTGSNVTAFLAPAVRAFFRNGGRRCWIVRVARREPKLNPLNRAQYNYFRVPGLERVTIDQQGKIVDGIESATLRARSEGSWSDALRVASSLVSRPSEKVVGTVRASGGELWIELENSKPNPVVVGDLLKLEYNGNVVLFVGVSSIGRPPVLSPPASPINPNSQRTIHIKSKQFISLSNGALDRPQARIPPATQLQSASVLSFELWVQKENDYLISLSDLGFEENHPRFWGNLPTDEVLYGNGSVDSSEPPSIVLWKPVGDIFRFPLAGTAEKNAFYFPTTMSAIPAEYNGRVELSGTSLERDGLAEFDAELFLDEELTDASTEDLLSRAEYIRDQSPAPRALKGIHAVLALDEATIVAVPDAVHLGWTRQEPEKPLPPINEPPPHRDEWWHFADCNVSPKTDLEWSLRDCDPKNTSASEAEKKEPKEPQWENFLNSDIEIITAPVLKFTRDPGGSGTINFKWTSAAADADFVLQESSSPNFADAEAVYAGRDRSVTIYGRRVGTFYYRVKAKVGRNFSDWSPGIVIAIRNETGWQSKVEQEFSSDTLIAVHRSLLRVSAARGDLFAVLSLPEHLREDQSIEFVTALKSLTARGKPTPAVVVLIDAESKTLSYGAVYHPWPIAREETRSSEIRSAPPCGSICGLMANRSIERGAWVAPANEALRGTVALNPTILRERRLDLQEANINLIRHEPRGFLVLDADTLSTDFDLRQINVRRLLSLLRRVALKLGATYVFEPHNEAFRRLVRRGFELLLDQLFERGAFAGTTPETAYQVVVDESLNNLNSVEQGRFIVELRVAPSLPLKFLTVRLVQNTDRGFVTERGDS